MQLMSISIIVIDTILNSERLLIVLSLLLQSLSNDSLTLLLEHPVAHSRCIRKMSFAIYICMHGCKARMYLHRPLPASSNKANVLSGNP